MLDPRLDWALSNPKWHETWANEHKLQLTFSRTFRFLRYTMVGSAFEQARHKKSSNFIGNSQFPNSRPKNFLTWAIWIWSFGPLSIFTQELLSCLNKVFVILHPSPRNPSQLLSNTDWYYLYMLGFERQEMLVNFYSNLSNPNLTNSPPLHPPEQPPKVKLFLQS